MTVWGIAREEFRQMRRGKLPKLAILLFLPLFFTLVFGTAYRNQFVRHIPGMTVRKKRRAVPAAPMDLPHEIQCFNRKPQDGRSGEGCLLRTAERGSPDLLDILLLQALRGGKSLLTACGSQAVVFIIRFSVTNENNPHKTAVPFNFIL